MLFLAARNFWALGSDRDLGLFVFARFTDKFKKRTGTQAASL